VALARTIIAVNDSAGVVNFTQLSIPDSSIASGSQATLSDYNSIADIQSDAELYAFVSASTIIINDGTQDLTREQSLNYISTLLSYTSGSSVDSHIESTSNPHSTSIANIGAGTLAQLNTAVSDDTVIADSDFAAQTWGFMRKTADSTYDVVKYNFSASASPGVNDDTGNGFVIGSRWIDTTADKEYVCLDNSAGSAVWTETTQAGGGSGDVIAPSSGSIVDNEVVVYDGAAGTNIKGTGVRLFPPGTSDPSFGTAADGDMYYNTTLNMYLAYDNSRSKWLSKEVTTLPFGRLGNTAAGSYYEGVGGIAFSDNRGWIAIHSGTIVSLSYFRDDTDAAVFQVTTNGTQISFLSSSALSGSDTTLNDDFAINAVLGVKNKTGFNAVNDSMGYVRIKWRAQ
jgi:hypothetical protein